MRALSALVGLALLALIAASDFVSDKSIKVFLFASPGFWSTSGIDAYKDMCSHLDNNLIDGRVESILIGGGDVPSVLQRTDNWYCTFYDNYDCEGNENTTLVASAGINNLRSVGWETKLHALQCTIENA